MLTIIVCYNYFGKSCVNLYIVVIVSIHSMQLRLLEFEQMTSIFDTILNNKNNKLNYKCLTYMIYNVNAYERMIKYKSIVNHSPINLNFWKS